MGQRYEGRIRPALPRKSPHNNWWAAIVGGILKVIFDKQSRITESEWAALLGSITSVIFDQRSRENRQAIGGQRYILTTLRRKSPTHKWAELVGSIFGPTLPRKSQKWAPFACGHDISGRHIFQHYVGSYLTITPPKISGQNSWAAYSRLFEGKG